MKAEYDVFEKISEEMRVQWHLYIDATYKSNPSSKNLGGEVLSKLLGVGNQGGFRYKGPASAPQYIALFTSGEDIYWRDELDENLGLFLYYGDQKTPGKGLLNTKLKGNSILKDTFLRAFSDDLEERKRIPPIFVFKKVRGRDIQFLGLAVPGIQGKPKKDWLTSVWGANRDGKRFENYKAYFTILNTSKGCEAEADESGINLAWLNDIDHNEAYESIYAPIEWKHYVDGVHYSPLTTIKETYVKKKEEQLPNPKDKVKCDMLKALQEYFVQKDRGYSFEPFACEIVSQFDNNVSRIEVTRPFKDGGIDGIGQYHVFSRGMQSVQVEFYMQAKCYKPFSVAVKVNDTARLISRIKNRQFGIMVTTSYVDKQAYEELLEDRHPIVLITGKNIMDIIFDKLEIRSVDALMKWLEKEF